jgi:hypothetical protein
MSLVFDHNIAVNVSAPTNVTGGDEFQVQVTLNKGNLESFSRLMQELPAGLKAKSVTSANADFTFKDNKVRLIWLKMPETENVTITYTIQVDQRLKGNFDLGGKFSYIDNNERKSVDATPVKINISPNPNIDSSLIVDIKDYKDKVIPELLPTDKPEVACIRQKPFLAPEADGSFVINLLVNKESAQKFAKIQEDVPNGFTALKIDSKAGIFSFKDTKAKFLWMNLPSDKYFMVSYRLVPAPGVTQAPILKGKFSYVIDDKTIDIDIVERDMDIANLTSEQVKTLVAEVQTKPAFQVPIAEIPQVKAIKDTTAKLLVAQKDIKTDKKKKWFWQKRPGDRQYMLEPEDGVYFRIQLAAGHKPIDIKRYFKKLKISDEVRIEEHDGWRKYSLGSFNEYKLARDYRIHIWNTTPIGDAFVAAYNSGSRITVQEALMITNQQWYR